MADTGEGIVPAEGASPGTSNAGGSLAFLNAFWINARITNVTTRINYLLDRLIDEGLLGSGYPPFETPVTDEMLQKMSPEEFRQLYDVQTSLEARSQLLNRMTSLKLPPRELLVHEPGGKYPVSPPVASQEHPPVSSSATAPV